MKALLLAAGRQQRWRDDGGTGYKQLIEIGGEAIIRRAYRLISERCPDVVTLVDNPRLRIWDGLNPRKPAHEAWMGEMGKFLDGRPYWPEAGEVVILYGDVYYTEACLDVIFSTPITQPTVFGRARSRRPESFAFRFDVADADEVERIARACAEAGLNDRGGPWRWFLHRHTGATHYGADGPDRVREIATPENGWVETPHDATDDFDKPQHVDTWLKRFGREEGRRIMPKRIATKRIYGIDHHGREVLVAAPGQPIPDGYREPAPAVNLAAPKPATTQSEKVTAELSSLTVPQLRELARRKGVEFDGLRKAELIQAIERAG